MNLVIKIITNKHIKENTEEGDLKYCHLVYEKKMAEEMHLFAWFLPCCVFNTD